MFGQPKSAKYLSDGQVQWKKSFLPWRMAQCCENSPPTNMASVHITGSMAYVGWVCCWFSPLLFRGVFLRVNIQFSPLLKNQHLQIPIRPGTHGHLSSVSWVTKLLLQLNWTYYRRNEQPRCLHFEWNVFEKEVTFCSARSLISLVLSSSSSSICVCASRS